MIQRLEDVGLKIVGIKMAVLDDEMTRKHYFDIEERYGKSVYEANARFMQPVTA